MILTDGGTRQYWREGQARSEILSPNDGGTQEFWAWAMVVTFLYYGIASETFRPYIFMV